MSDETLEFKLQDRGMELLTLEDARTGIDIVSGLTGILVAGLGIVVAKSAASAGAIADQRLASALAISSPVWMYGTIRWLTRAIRNIEREEHETYHKRHAELSEIVVLEGFESPKLESLSRDEYDGLRFDYALELASQGLYREAMNQADEIGRRNVPGSDQKRMVGRRRFVSGVVEKAVHEHMGEIPEFELWNAYEQLSSARVKMSKKDFRRMINYLLDGRELDKAREALKFHDAYQPLSQRQMRRYRERLSDLYLAVGQTETGIKVKQLADYTTLWSALDGAVIRELES